MPSSKTVYLEYAFIFDPNANLWSRLYEWEKDLADFFAANGLEAEPLSTIDGSSNKRIMMIKRIDQPTEKLVNTKGANIQKMLPESGPRNSTAVTSSIIRKLR